MSLGVVVFLAAALLCAAPPVRSDGDLPDLEGFEGWGLEKVIVREVGPDGKETRHERGEGSSVVGEAKIGSLVDEILGEYREEGYLLARVDQVSPDVDSIAEDLRLEVRLERGPLCRLSEVVLEGNRALKEDEFARLTGLVVGARMGEGAIRDDLDRVMAWYRDHGFPYAEGWIAALAIDGDGAVRLSLAFREEKHVRIGRIAVGGNRLTREGVVLRQFGLHPGESFSQVGIDRGRERLVASDLYDRVEEVTLWRGERPYEVDLGVVVEEGRPNAFSGMAGMVPGRGDRVRLTGLLHLLLGNLWGTGRKIDVKWVGQGEGISRLDLRYREPWIGPTPISGEVRFVQELRDTLFHRVEVTLVGSGPIVRGIEARAGYQHQGVYTGRPGRGDDRGSSRQSIVLGVSRSPGDGTSWGADLEFLVGRRRIDRGRFGEIEGVGHLFTPLRCGRHRDLRVSVGGRFIASPIRPVPDYHLFSIGGTETVRGYAEDRIWGNRAVWGRTELGFAIDGDSRYLVFYDLGAIDTAGDGGPGRVVQGYGIGARVGSKLGVMAVDYALSPGAGPLGGRIHTAWSRDF